MLNHQCNVMYLHAKKMNPNPCYNVMMFHFEKNFIFFLIYSFYYFLKCNSEMKH